MQLRWFTRGFNHIEAAGRIGHGGMVLEVQLRSVDQAAAFVRIDRGRAATEVLSRAVAHFHEDHGAGVIHHQVQFTAAITHVARARLHPSLLQMLRHLPVALQSVLALEPQIIGWAEDFARKDNALFLGRGLHYPIALEGALKLKEVTYIHAEAYAAGELKHGPLALVTSEMPVVAVAPNDMLLEKLKSNLQEVRARGGVLYVLAAGDTKIKGSEGLHVIRMPEHYGALSPLLHVVPLQLLAYHTACARGTDVDKPRNLAKSVTVE